MCFGTHNQMDTSIKIDVFEEKLTVFHRMSQLKKRCSASITVPRRIEKWYMESKDGPGIKNGTQLKSMVYVNATMVKSTPNHIQRHCYMIVNYIAARHMESFVGPPRSTFNRQHFDQYWNTGRISQAISKRRLRGPKIKNGLSHVYDREALSKAN